MIEKLLTPDEANVRSRILAAYQAGQIPEEAATQAMTALATREAVRLYDQLPPEYRAALQNVIETQGGAGLRAVLAQHGAPPELAEYVGQLADQGGTQAVTSMIDTGYETEHVRMAVERASPQPGDSPEVLSLKEKSPLYKVLQDPEAQRQAYRMYKETGRTPEQGRSPLEDQIGQVALLEDADGSLLANAYRNPGEFKMTPEEQNEAHAKFIRQPAAATKAFKAAFDQSQSEHMLLARAGQRDAKTTKVPLDKDAAIRLKKEAAHRAHLERSFDQLDAADRQKHARLSARPVREAPAPSRPLTAQERYESRRGTIAQAAERIEAGEDPRAAPEPVAEVSSRRAALEAGFDALEAGEEVAP
jgi:hypothetical protein